MKWSHFVYQMLYQTLAHGSKSSRIGLETFCEPDDTFACGSSFNFS
jgi:hypothetical protein